MKRVRCPRCDHYIKFDDTLYKEGQSLMFKCDSCSKQFSIRIGSSKLKQTLNKSEESEELKEDKFGSIMVIENAFGYKQTWALKKGDNLIGRYNKGDNITIPIETSDLSMDRRHCIITVQKEPNGKLTWLLRDFPSFKGTFLHNRLLADREKAIINDGAVITLGATTIIFSTPS